jgi:hypothetical protein
MLDDWWQEPIRWDYVECRAQYEWISPWLVCVWSVGYTISENARGGTGGGVAEQFATAIDDGIGISGGAATSGVGHRG